MQPQDTKYENFYKKYRSTKHTKIIDSVTSSVNRVDAISKATGKETYISDYYFDNMIYARLIRTKIVRGYIKSIKLPTLPEGYYFITKDDIPEGGKNCLNMILSDWKCFAEGEIRYKGETIGVLCGEDREKLFELEKQIVIEYEEKEAATTIEEALNCKGGAFVKDNNIHCSLELKTGDDTKNIIANAPIVLEESIETGYQEHASIETNGVIVTKEDGKFVFYASSQCPFYIRKSIYTLLNIPMDDIIVRQTSMGGAFGGKEHFPDVLAGPLLVAENKINRPIKLIFTREEETEFSVKRHPSVVKFKTALDEQGNILAIDSDIYYNVGGYLSSSFVVLQRGCFHLTGVYRFPSAHIRGYGVATNTFPSCAFRGFGAPQTLFAIETHLSHIAKKFGVDPLVYKMKYLLKKGSTTSTNGKVVENVMLPDMIKDLTAASSYYKKSKKYGYGTFKGIGVAMYNHGGAFTGNGESAIINAHVTVKKCKDGNVEILCGQTEMGQGIKTALSKIASVTLELPLDKIVYKNPDTSRVPDSGPTAASRSVMVPGFLIEKACLELKEHLNEEEYTVTKAYEHPEGYPWDQSTFQGYAYLGYGWGMAIVEVEIDKRTYEVKIKHIWTSHDAGETIDRKIADGQVNGGVAQGIGWASNEVLDNVGGKFKQVSLSDYIIPTSMDLPTQYVSFNNDPYKWGPYGAKGIGELVFNGVGAAYVDAVSRALNRDISKIPLPSEEVFRVFKNNKISIFDGE